MSAQALQVPRFDHSRPDSLVVTRWGQVGDATLRPGDRLILGADEQGWVVLVSHGWGRPMVGRWKKGRLWAEPGCVPVSAARWAVAGGVSAVERELGRGRPLEEGAWVVLHAEGGGLGDARWMSPSELEALSIKVTVSMGEDGERLAIGVSLERDEAVQLATSAAWGHLRFSLRRREAADALVIVGPWAGSATKPAHAPGPQVQLSLFGDTPRGNVSP
jgi:hypothetical protein